MIEKLTATYYQYRDSKSLVTWDVHLLFALRQVISSLWDSGLTLQVSPWSGLAW